MKRYQLIMALFASFLLLVEGVQARITMPSFFSDGMVLQQKVRLPFGEAVTGNSRK